MKITVIGASAGVDLELVQQLLIPTILPLPSDWQRLKPSETTNRGLLMYRVAQPEDAEAIAQLHATSWRFAYRGALSDEYLAGDIITDRRNLWHTRLTNPAPNQYVLLAKTNQLLGFACLALNDNPTWGSLLDNIHVSQSALRQGIGSGLLTQMTTYALNHAPRAGLYLWVLQNNDRAQQFYYRHGADCVGEDIWFAPDGTQIPRYRFAWPATKLPI